ncbi:DUF4303 domain-containing protein [Gemmata sp. G18]|uniref:DUF4303 domain-containing protein n=1 Tax=Gemmata palustris TaxID=2822762 RepID=A0ABS5BQU1_9BACT|nr:DUF4303 domain-containing protein [Gemmata palustris]MBP3956059.1 DUF4303 domain-containing protein [Gemmata palustris]
MFDRVAAEDRLYCISKKQIAQFLNGVEQDNVYGFGFFCDGYDGTVLLVANTEQYHLSNFLEYEARFGATDSEFFRWDVGNWKYPAGLFSSSSTEQSEFEDAWKEHREPLSQTENEAKQEILEDICFKVLKRLVQERTFSGIPGVKGVTVLGPLALQESVLEKKKSLDRLLQ